VFATLIMACEGLAGGQLKRMAYLEPPMPAPPFFTHLTPAHDISGISAFRTWGP
jgi:hypothetical protein